MSDKTMTFVSLYSGAGGLDLGFCEAGFRPVFAIDRDAAAADMYSTSFKLLADRLWHLRCHDHALDRTQPSLPMRPGRNRTLTRQ